MSNIFLARFATLKHVFNKQMLIPAQSVKNPGVICATLIRKMVAISSTALTKHARVGPHCAFSSILCVLQRDPMEDGNLDLIQHFFVYPFLCFCFLYQFF